MKSYDSIDDLMKAVEEEWEAMPWYKKTWEIIYHILGDVWSFLLHDLPYGIRNFWYFKGVIFKFRSWDFQYNLDILARSLELTRESIVTDPHRYPQSSETYANAMGRAIEIIQNSDYDNDEEWEELWTIILGSKKPSVPTEVRDGDDAIVINITDGTDMRRWWT